MTLRVDLLVPEGEIWAGQADRVVAKTLEGDIGILTGHTPVLGILAQGSLVRILPEDGQAADGWVQAAVGDGFLSVADDQVSILARQAQLGTDVDTAAVRSELESARSEAAAADPESAEAARVRYLSALLRAAGDDRPLDS
jgi:F-type H+-transporting ATPase subunit epsilon